MKILIIKLGALGDVVRTLPIAKAIRKEHPAAEITWITKENALDLFYGNKDIDKVLSVDSDLPEIEYDIVYSLDIDDKATEISEKTKSKKKLGFFKEEGFLVAYNSGAEEYVNTVYDDYLKKSNRKTYQELIFSAADLNYSGEHETILVNEDDDKKAKDFFSNLGIDKQKLIGIHLGASNRWPSKVWSEERLEKFIEISKKNGFEILLFGGSNEVEKQNRIVESLKEKGVEVFEKNTENRIGEFVALVKKCKAMICSDSFSLHVSIALKKPTIGLFFCTSPHEIEDYGLLNKLVSEKLEEFFPEKMDQFDEDLIKSISEEQVLTALEDVGRTKVVTGIIRESEKILVIKRKETERVHGGLWTFPGGVVEDGETAQEALKREIFEEVGLNVIKIGKKISNYQYDRGEERLALGSTYLIESFEGETQNGEEVEEYRWVTLEELDKLDLVEGVEEEAFSSLIG